MKRVGNLEGLLERVRACEECAADLELGPRPVLQIGRGARVLIIGQAPGVKVHESGTAWKDASGRLLREWLGVDEEIFYDGERVALMPMGFCYPGKGKSGDLPPRGECAPLWHEALRGEMRRVGLTILIGRYAQGYYLGERAGVNLTETVRGYGEYLPEYFPLPHPSPRNRFWLGKNRWFEEDVLPELRERVEGALSPGRS